MSYQEKRTITTIITGLLVLAAYCLYAFNPVRMSTLTPGDLKPWAVSMLIFIGIGVGASIIIQIVFHILLSISIAVKEKMNNRDCDDKVIEKTIGAEMIEDERDKLIELKASKVGFGVAGGGFLLALLAIVLKYSPVVMLNILFFTMSLGSIIEGFVQLAFYRRGVWHA